MIRSCKNDFHSAMYVGNFVRNTMERGRILPWLLILGVFLMLQFLIFGFPTRKVWNDNEIPPSQLATQELSSLRAKLQESETENKQYRADVSKLIGQSTMLNAACPSCPSCPAAAPLPPPPPAKPQSMSVTSTSKCVHLESAIEKYVSYMGSLLARNEKNDWYIGRYDAIVVAPMLRPLFDGITPQLIIDIGANTGDTAADFVPIYTEVDCMRYQKRRPPTGPHDDCHQSSLRVISYEPVPENFAILKLRGDEEGWSDAGWRAYQVATTSPQVIAESGSSKEPGHGTLKFFARLGADGKMVGGDQQGGLVQAAVQSSTFVLVDAWTLDEHLKSIGEVSTSILLLKIDVEGSDGSVLRGAEESLRSHRVRFVVFEYNSKWNYPGGDSLAGITKWMEQLRYVCYWITPDGFVPLSGKYWHSSYEFWTWSNVLCTREGDVQGDALVSYYNTIKQTLPIAC